MIVSSRGAARDAATFGSDGGAGSLPCLYSFREVDKIYGFTPARRSAYTYAASART